MSTACKHQNQNDYTKKDGIIKEQVFLEDLTRTVWEKKWNFMKDFDKFCLEAAAGRGISEEKYRQMTKRHKGFKQTDVTGWDVKSSGYVPKTSSGFIGWRSGQRECSLEKLGPLYVSPRFTIQPPDMEPEPRITQIILG